MGSEVHFSHVQLRRDVRCSETWTRKVTAPTLQGHIWLGMCTESGIHFRAGSSGVFKTRTVRRLSPSLQVDVDLLPLQPEQPPGLSSEGATASQPDEPNLA